MTKQEEITWIKPPKDVYKLNVDPALKNDGGGGASVIQNDKDEVIAGACWPLHHLLDADAATTEAKALQHGLNLIENLGCIPVIVESDCLELVQTFSGTIQVWGPYAAILVDCFQIAHRICDISLQHCNREANYVAHNLDRHAIISNSTARGRCVPGHGGPRDPAASLVSASAVGAGAFGTSSLWCSAVIGRRQFIAGWYGKLLVGLH